MVKKFISGALLAFVVIGSLATLLAIGWPYLALTGLKFVDGAPDAPNFIDDVIRFLASLIQIVPFALFLGGLSAVLYTFLVDDSENKVFLRIWSVFLFGVFVVYTYPYIQVYFR